MKIIWGEKKRGLAQMCKGYFEATINAKSGLFLKGCTLLNKYHTANSQERATVESLSFYVANASTDLCAAADLVTWTRVLKEQQQHWRRSRVCSAVQLSANQRRRCFAWSLRDGLWFAKGQRRLCIIHTLCVHFNRHMPQAVTSCTDKQKVKFQMVCRGKYMY